MKKDQIVVIGDIMLDRYIHGDCTRISPEAPVPVLQVKSTHATLGGAANVAKNLALLGAKVAMIGLIGPDESGDTVRQLLSEAGITPHCPAWIEKTTTKTRIVARNQQMIRIDTEVTASLEAPLEKELIDQIDWNRTSAIIVSDYAKGTCSPTILQLLMQKAKDNTTPVFVDPKGRDWSKYKGAFLIKPNTLELEEFLGTSNEQDMDNLMQKRILSDLAIPNLLWTRGSKGMTLVQARGQKHFPTKKVEVYDVSGAGDTTIAVLVHSYIQDHDLEKAIRYSNAAGTFVVTKANTYAIKAEELQEIIKGLDS